MGDATSQFLAPRDQVGSNRAEASLQRVQQLNPMVEVTADSGCSKDKNADFFKQFDLVVATTCNKEELIRINSICRAENIFFYAGDVFGFFGFSFMDLISHSYVEEITSQVHQDKTDVTEDGPPAKKQKTDTEPETETKTVKKAMAFKSLSETLKVDWSSELYSKRIRRMDPSFFLLQVLFAFKAETGHNPRPSARADDLAKLKDLRNQTLTSLSVPTTKIPDQMLGLLFAELS